MGLRKYLSQKRFSTKQVVVLLVLAFLGVAVFTYATVSIPYTFTAGTTAKSSEVNANFQALADTINNRTSATLSSMAGTWKYTLNGSYLNTLSGNTICTYSRTGSLTLNSDGTFSDTQNDTNNYCQGTGVVTNTGATYTGTWAVSANGSGTLTYTSFSISIQTSKDLNAMTSTYNTPTGNYPSNSTTTYLRQ